MITNQELFRLYLQESRGAKTPSRIPIINLSELISTGAIEISNLAEEIGAQKTSLPIVSALIVVGTTEMIAHRFLTNQEIGGDPVAIAAKVVDLILEGIRPGRVVRICPGSWPQVQIPREEYLGGNKPEERFPTPDIFPKY